MLLTSKVRIVADRNGKDADGYITRYGFRNVITPGDIKVTFPDIMPFSSEENYVGQTRPLSQYPLAAREVEGSNEKAKLLKVDAILVFNDPRDWILDSQIILDLLLSHAGYLGSQSSKNGDASLLNRGYQQDSQPPIYFSNPDLFWAAAYHLPRLGQGGFREAFEGIWSAVTGGEKMGVKLGKRMFGKPFQGTFEFAEKRLVKHREETLMDEVGSEGLKNVYMIGGLPWISVCLVCN